MNVCHFLSQTKTCRYCCTLFNFFQPKHGALQAPAKLRDEGMFKRLELLGMSLML